MKSQQYNSDLLKRYLLLFGIQEINILPEDVLCQLHQWLSHAEERENPERDEWGNWEHQFSKLNYQEPFADQLVLNNIDYKPKSIWPEGKKFAVCITHDIDSITSTNQPRVAKRWLFKKRRELSRGTVLKSYLKLLYRNLTEKKEHDILWMNEKWIDFELEHKVPATIFFMHRPHSKNLSKYDNDYLYRDKLSYKGSMITIKEYCRMLAKKGFEIGIHGSFYTFDNQELFTDQKRRLERILGKTVYSTRQHYLHYDINKTPKIHDEADILIDSTLGYNQAIGFRSGTCFPYFLLDNNNKVLNTLEVPQIVMDAAVFHTNALSVGKGEKLKSVVEYMDKVESVGGCFTVNFHPEKFIDEDYFTLFKETILEAKKRGAYFGTLKEINDIVRQLND